MTPERPNEAVFQKRETIASNAGSKVGGALAAVALASLKPEDRDEFDANIPGAMREVDRGMRDIGASEMGKMAIRDCKNFAQTTGEMIPDGAMEQALAATGLMPE